MGYEKRKKRRASALLPATPGVDKDWNKRWEAEQDLSALARVEAIKCDPDRMKRAKALAKEKLDENKGKREEAQRLIELGTDGAAEK